MDTSNRVDKSKNKYSNFLTWEKNISNNEIDKFKKIIEDKYNLHFNNYWDLHRWTVDNFPNFWEEVWIHFGIVFSKSYEKVFVRTGPGFLENKWFTGAEFNFAENFLRKRSNQEALVCLDEEGNLDKVTFDEMFEEVKLYAAAFRKQGLRKGDRVACYMSNRKEAIYVMLAATSIGAIWGGPQPYLGTRAASYTIQNLDAKFLIVVDRIQDECSAEEHNLIEKLSIIAECAPTLQCIIIIPTKDETLQMDISHIPKSCLLEEFLASGRTTDGGVRDMVFEQLPFEHPVFISFTSGTTDLPLGIVHSAGSLLGPMVDLGLHYNLKSGDTIFSIYTIGWIIWNYMVSALSLGVRLFLLNGCIYRTRGGKNVWDLISEHRVSFTYVDTIVLDRMQKMDMQPKHSRNFEHLQFFMSGGGPVKLQNYKYLKSILEDNVFIGNLYAASESFGPYSGCDLNAPCYAREVQVPALGKDVQVFEKDKRLLNGNIGELVVTTPSLTFLIGLWKDRNNEQLKKTYFSKYPDIWQQHDIGYINPRTKGLVILGRSDGVIMQNGLRLGSNDIYFAIDDMEEIDDYICVGQNKSNGYARAILFLKLNPGHSFTPVLREKVARKVESELWICCVPEVILQVAGIPYNANNQRFESLVRKIVATNHIPEEINIKSPECLKDFCNIPEIMNCDG